MLLASSCFLEPPVLEYRGMIDFPACPGMCHLYGFLIQGFLASLHFHFLDCLISQLLHVETVRHTACGSETDTCCLFHVRSHVEGYLPALEASASGKLQQSRSDSPDIGALYDCNDTS